MDREHEYLPTQAAGIPQGAAARLENANGVSLNQWIASAVAQKVGVIETVQAFLEGRAGVASEYGLAGVLEKVRDVSPVDGDEFHRK